MKTSFILPTSLKFMNSSEDAKKAGRRKRQEQLWVTVWYENFEGQWKDDYVT